MTLVIDENQVDFASVFEFWGLINSQKLLYQSARDRKSTLGSFSKDKEKMSPMALNKDPVCKCKVQTLHSFLSRIIQTIIATKNAMTDLDNTQIITADESLSHDSSVIETVGRSFPSNFSSILL
jgi:hypothetical protein